MSAKAKGLGRSLGEIFSAGAGDAAGRALEVAPKRLRPSPFQPRTRMDPKALDELAQTVAARGVLQPILVRPRGEDYEIIAGERRWRAAQRAGLASVPVVVKECSDRDAMLAALVENIQRQDLSALEQAAAARNLIKELGSSVSDMAAALGMSRPALSNLLRLLKLAPGVRKLLADESISAGHARAIASAPAARQLALAKEVAARGLTVRQTEALAQKETGPKRPPKKQTAVDADTARLCEELSTRLGMRVSISRRGKGGQLTVRYRSHESLDALLALLRR
ncbi:MAG: ParB/RepB/Spo0J family partition protein [Betaproteobacteria bacterium AqS2]|uniref:Probable chromosome-partitioning protein ParB n=1 Tax=Candidatus Amphirhobacter heronislandensis TaxID=1732024 RepID=A0A930UHP1_9GAMM|nr:ParB/RepB/Spo0J family partition protein [Betaproteobacteria bacterium AqS2]